MRMMHCRYCYGKLGLALFCSPRFPSIIICSDCLDKVHIGLTNILGEDFIQAVCSSSEPHVLKNISKGPLFKVDSTRHFAVKTNDR